jgi:hypothetical protein
MSTTPPQEPTPGRRFEDLDVPIPVPSSVRRRNAVITTAAVILFVSGVLGLLTVLFFRPGGSGAVLFAILGVAQLIGAALVIALIPIGRPVGIVLACVGLAVGVSLATSSAVNGLMTMALHGFVIYALASNGPAFRRG